MKLLLDEILSPDIAEQLRDRGHDVEALSGSEHAGFSDPEVLDLARAQRRAVVTNNVRDFRPLHVAAVSPGGPGHFGMVFIAGRFRRTKAGTGRIVDTLDALLAAHSDLVNGEAWL